eukprot:1143742-Pelagomonas_calceolata.AAC.1
MADFLSFQISMVDECGCYSLSTSVAVWECSPGGLTKIQKKLWKGSLALGSEMSVVSIRAALCTQASPPSLPMAFKWAL